MRGNVELAATIRSAMEKKKLDRQKLAQVLGISNVMIDKLLCGEIVPSQHLRKLMIEVLNIEPSRVDTISERREGKTKRQHREEEQTRKRQKRSEAA